MRLLVLLEYKQNEVDSVKTKVDITKALLSGSGFRKTAQALIDVAARQGRIEAGDVLPSRNTVAKIVGERAEQTRQRLREELPKQPFIAASTDIWTEIKTQTPFTTVNVSYITSDWSLHNRVVGTRAIPEAHTGVNILRALRQILESVGCWGDGSHIKYVTDNACNNKTAFQNRGRGWQSCYCHNLNLVMGKVMHEAGQVADLVENGKRLVRYAKKNQRKQPAQDGGSTRTRPAAVHPDALELRVHHA